MNRETSSTSIQTREWKWVFIWSLVILIFSSIPYLVGWWVAENTGLTFGGFIIGVEDGNSYLSKMGQGARGRWLFNIMYTSEPHDGVPFFLFHLFLGKLAAALPETQGGLPLRMIWVYHLARLAGSFFLLVVIYRFASEFLQWVQARRFAWFLVALGGGLGWLFMALGLDNWLGSTPLDFILPEGFTFLVILTLPHIAVARAFLLLGLLEWKRTVWPRKGERTMLFAIKAGLAWLAMSILVPFYAAVVAAVIGTTLLILTLVWRRVPIKEGGYSLIAGLIVAPMVLISIWVFSTEPVMKGWAAQNLILSPPWPHYVLAYLVPGIFAGFELVWLCRARTLEKYWLLVAWVLVVPPLLYAPFNLQRRLIEGYQIPLYILAVRGLVRLLENRNFFLWRAGVLALMLPTSLVLVVGGTAAALSAQPPIFHSPAQVAMANWLATHAPEDALVLSDYQTSNFLPGWAPVRAYLGHGPETINLTEKKMQVERFFSIGTDSDWRQDFLEANDIHYIVIGPKDSGKTGYELSQLKFLTERVREGRWLLLEVSGAGNE